MTGLGILGLPLRWARMLRHAKPSTRRMVDRLAEPLDDLLSLLFEETQVGTAIVDRNGTVVRANGALGTLCRRAPGALVGRPVTALFHPARPEADWKELFPVLRGSRGTEPFNTVLAGMDGGEGPAVRVVPAPLREADGTVSGAVLHLSDLTAQQQLEEQLAHGQKLQAMGQLTGGIAHDFNNLLTAIIGASDEALGRDGLTPEVAEDLHYVRQSATRGSKLVKQLLAFGRQQTLDPKVLPLNEAVQDLAVMLRRALGTGVTVVLDLEEPGRLVRVDPSQLDQVLVNLAVNGRDAMAGHGTLTVRTTHAALFRPLVRGDETVPAGRYAVIEVADTGCGIPPDVLPRIFDPFFTTRREKGGNGLGLATVHGIVRQSDGFVTVDSTPGAGTRFRVHLPCHRPGAVPAIPPMPRSAPTPAPAPPIPSPATPVGAAPGATAGGAGRTVLVVDDENTVRRLAERALAARGWQVLSASCGEAAMELLGSGPGARRIDLLVSDVVMPGMDGVALVRAVRAGQPGLPAILASGYAEDALRRQAQTEGTCFLSKPYTLKQLASAAEQATATTNPPGSGGLEARAMDGAEMIGSDAD